MGLGNDRPHWIVWLGVTSHCDVTGVPRSQSRYWKYQWHPCLDSSVGRATGLANQGSGVQIPLQAKFSNFVLVAKYSRNSTKYIYIYILWNFSLRFSKIYKKFCGIFQEIQLFSLEIYLRFPVDFPTIWTNSSIVFIRNIPKISRGFPDDLNEFFNCFH